MTSDTKYYYCEDLDFTLVNPVLSSIPEAIRQYCAGFPYPVEFVGSTMTESSIDVSLLLDNTEAVTFVFLLEPPTNSFS